jgi:multiple sugar transport system substrate-binding protein
MKLYQSAVMFVCCALTLVLTACGGSAKKGPVEFTFYEHSDGEIAAKMMGDAYNALNNGTKVNVSIIANDDYDDKIKVMLSGGGDIDAFWIRQPSQAAQLGANGSVLALDDLVKKDKMDLSVYGNLAAAFQKNGKTYGLAYNKSAWMLFYNKDLFDKAKIDYPINLTWEQYADLAKKLKTAGKWGGVIPNWTMNLGASAVGEYLTADKLPRTMEYANVLKRLYVTDHSHPSIEEMSGSFDINAFFAEGKTYMMINGDWEFALFPKANPKFAWAAAPLPRFADAKEQATVGGSSCMSVAKKAKHQKEAFAFIKYYCYSDAGAEIIAKTGGVPAFPSEKALAVYKQTVTTPGADYLFSANVGPEQGDAANYGELNDAYKAEITEALVSNKSMDDAFNKFYARRTEINAKK